MRNSRGRCMQCRGTAHPKGPAVFPVPSTHEGKSLYVCCTEPHSVGVANPASAVANAAALFN